MNDLKDDIEKLNKAIDAAKVELTTSAAIKVEDLSQMAGKYLSEKAKLAMSRKAQNQIVVEHGKAYICTYFGVRVPASELETGVLRLATIANELADKELVHSTLAPISSIELIQQAMEVPSRAVFLFVLVPAEELKTIENNYHPFTIREGELPKDMISCKEKLAPGEFSAVIAVSHALSMVYNVKSPEERIEDEINTYLAVLPKGTKILHKRNLPIVSTAYETEVRFYNPLLHNVKKVELQHVRVAAPSLDGNGVLQGNVLVGVSYYDEEGKKLYQ